AVDDAEARGRDAELRAFGREAQVTRHRDGHRAAHAEAEDHGHRRLGTRADGGVGEAGLRVVVHRALDVLALLLELGDVRTGRERHGAGAAIDDRPYRLL